MFYIQAFVVQVFYMGQTLVVQVTSRSSVGPVCCFIWVKHMWLKWPVFYMDQAHVVEVTSVIYMGQVTSKFYMDQTLYFTLWGLILFFKVIAFIIILPLRLCHMFEHKFIFSSSTILNNKSQYSV